MQRLLSAALAVILFVPAVMAATPDSAPAPAGPTVPAGIAKLLDQLQDGFNRGDAKRLAACWAPQGDFIGLVGERIAGREMLEKAFEKSLADRKNAKLQLQPTSVRLLGDAVALVEANTEVKPAPPTGGASSALLVLVQRDGRWLIESGRVTLARPPAPTQHLAAIEWLVGDWATDAPSGKSGVSLHTTCDWTVNRAFLIRKFKLEAPNALLHAGTEVIGWDPRTERIRSWDFDSNGNFGENVWVPDGKRWLIKYSGTQADGSEVSATHTLTVVDADTITLESHDRTVNGQRQPDVAPITLKRQAKAKAAAKKPPERILP